MSKIKINPLALFYHIIKNDVHKLEYDPTTQWKVHRKMTWFWVFNLIGATSVFFLAPGLWAKASILYLVLISLYANLATDYGAVPASYAAMKADEIQDAQKDVLVASNELTEPPVMTMFAHES